jgi:hypothetical protein
MLQLTLLCLIFLPVLTHGPHQYLCQTTGSERSFGVLLHFLLFNVQLAMGSNTASNYKLSTLQSTQNSMSEEADITCFKLYGILN